jgi:polysaccharide biosynthesis/export protein
MTSNLRPITWMLSALAVIVSTTGCQLWHGPGPYPPPPPMIPPSIPKELDKAPLPEYVIEPPDVLAVSAISLIPKHPYQLRPLDVLHVQVSGLPGEPNVGDFPVALDGQFVTGFDFDYVGQQYQPIQAAGRTVEEVRADIEERVRSTGIVAPKVSLSLVSIAAQQDIAGEHLVAPDGKVTLGTYGRVCLVGMTIDEAKRAIEGHLAQYFEDPKISLDVYGYNSKVYYVITQGAGLGDQVIRLPVKGSETALDAIAEIQGLTASSSLKMWVARPGFNSEGGDQILPVDWLGITQRGDFRSNYQLMPGDRLYVAEDRLVAIDTALAKLFSPVERIFGVTLLGVQTANSFATFGQVNSGGF